MYIILLPAYMPEKSMLSLLENAKREKFEIVIVDDGSGENYTSIFFQAKLYGTVLSHHMNRGKGAALKTGMKYIQNHYADEDIVVTLDADGQHTIEDALRLCHLAEEHPGELLLGSRKLDDGVPLRSKFGNTVTRWVYRLSTGVSVHDTQTGMRAFRVDRIPELLNIEGERYEYEMNVLLQFPKQGIAIREMEIATIYLNDNESSHFDTVKDSIRIYKDILKFSASSLISFCVDYGLYSIFSIAAAMSDLSYGLIVANVSARVISSIVNYSINRNMVFHSKVGVGKSALEYFLLAACILAGNTCVLSLLVNGMGINPFAGKILTEILFFFISWTVQRKLIFKQQEATI